jgi:chromosome partitioning protein
MSIPTLTFFNNKGGVGKTTLVYHLSWMFAELGVKTLVVDCDPQANLTAAFVDEESLFKAWTNSTDKQPETIFQSVQPLTETGDFIEPKLFEIKTNLHLIAGDLALSGFEDSLSGEWGRALEKNTCKRAMSLLSVFWRLAQSSAKTINADLIIFDVGPNLGAINRSVLIGSDHVVVPLAADMFSLQGLGNMRPTLEEWRTGWDTRLNVVADVAGKFPLAAARPLGYIALQHQERLNRPVKAFGSWLEKIPAQYQKLLDNSVKNKTNEADSMENTSITDIKHDPNCLARLRHYKSLMPMAQEARKPVFKLRPVDGAFGSNVATIQRAYDDFEILAKNILSKMNIQIA